ncbi:hypothetical protein P4C99_11025 [Pontiellaceae bacterium B1224]|nr:hypothetical protein [Pontiellaceae bacterium B1224]
MSAQSIKHISVMPEYKEESVKIPVAITMVLLLLVCTPLVLWIIKINDEGSRATDISQYNALVSKVNNDVRTVDAILRNDAEELEAIRSAQRTQVVTLIVPEVVIIEERAGAAKAKPLNISLDGIYWSPNNPLVSIGDETYRIGDVLQGYEIIGINKTTVQFQAADGTLIVKDMYEDLLMK